MMYLWHPDMLRFMRDASEHTNYNDALARELLPYLNQNSRVCDAGCGLGYLAMALAPHVKQVTALDISPKPLAALREICPQHGVNNLDIYCGDIEAYTSPQPFDAMTFCFFGHEMEPLRWAKRLCRGTIMLVKKNYTKHRFSVGSHVDERNFFPTACSLLEKEGIPFVCKELSLDLGQPFRSLEDARRFFELYSRDEDNTLITEEFLRSRLIETDGSEFPYFMPHKRDVGIILVHTDDLPENLLTNR